MPEEKGLEEVWRKGIALQVLEIRGGSWNNDGGNCRSANRYRSTPDFRCRDLGFRVAAVQSR